jgi:seryl-tRNA synthetase
MVTGAVDPDPWKPWREDLVGAGLLVPSGLDGIWGRSGVFESVVRGLEDTVARLGADQGAAVVRFSPVVPRAVFERTGYLRSFPDLTGSIHTFVGGDRDHAEVLRLLDAGEDWTVHLAPAGTVLCSAACHPLYPTIRGPLPAGGHRWDVYGHVYRHEPSLDPARMQSFRQYEFVYVGEPDGARRHRDLWLERGLGLMDDLGLDAGGEVANDPFFGRAGRLLAANQKAGELKYEILAATGPADKLTAVASANCHEDHFGAEFGILTAEGAAAHSACVGFGVERITLALLWAYGLEPDRWPTRVRAVLWP